MRGKVLRAHRLSRKFGYQHISMDSIIAGFERAFPELGISTYADMPSMELLCHISGKIAPFIKAMLQRGEYDEFSPGMVLDVCQLLPEDFIKHLSGENCSIFYFITADVTPEERFRIQKTYDTAKDYSFYKTDGQLREGCVSIVEQSKFIKKQCLEYGLPFYETARNREIAFEDFLRLF